MSGMASHGDKQQFVFTLDDHASITSFSPADTSPPVITPSVSGTLGSSGWYTSDVVVSWTVTDAESPVESSSCAPVSVTSDTAGTTFSCSATTAGGTASSSITIKRDTTAPTIACASPDGQWHASDVAFACTALDSASGLANSADASFSLSTHAAAGAETGNASTDSRQVCDNIGHCATAGPIGGNKVDKKSPSIVITAPAGTYLAGQIVAASYFCTDGGSGVASCTGTVPNGANINTTTVGAASLSIQSVDQVGNHNASVASYMVAYNICPLYDWNIARKSGSAYPIRLQLCDSGGTNLSSSSLAVHVVSVTRISSSTLPTLDDTGNANPDSDFRYDSLLQGYIFNLGTKGYNTGIYSLKFTAGSDPTLHSALFAVK